MTSFNCLISARIFYLDSKIGLAEILTTLEVLRVHLPGISLIVWLYLILLIRLRKSWPYYKFKVHDD